MSKQGPTKEGFVSFLGYNVWYRIVGDRETPGKLLPAASSVESKLQQCALFAYSARIPYEERMRCNYSA